METRATQERIERGVLEFSRELVGPGVHLAKIALRKGDTSTAHRHTHTRDTFYVMDGRLTVTIDVEENAMPTSHYRLFSATPVEVMRVSPHVLAHKVCLAPGEVLIIEPGVVHCAANPNEGVCRFLCIEGVGAYDFVVVGPNGP